MSQKRVKSGCASKVALHFTNQVAARQAVRRECRRPSVGFDSLSVLVLVLQRDIEVVPGNRIVR